MASKDADSNLLKPVIELLKLEKQDISIIFLLTIGSGLLALATPLAVQTLVNVVTMGGAIQPLVVLSIMLFILLSLSGGLYILEYYVVELILRRVFVRGALQAAQAAQAMDISVADAQNPIELMNRFFDVTTVQKTSYQLLTKGLAAALQALLGSLVLMFYSFYFAAIAIFLLLMAWFVVVVVGRVAVQSAIHESYAKYNMAAWLENIAHHLNMFKFGTGKDLAVQRADSLASDYLSRRRAHFSTLLRQNIIAVTVSATAGSLMLGLGGWLVMSGHINLGQFVAAELIIFGVLGAFLSFVSKLEYFYDMVAALDKLGMIHDLPKECHAGHPMQLESAPELTCRDVTLELPTHTQAIRAIHFTAEKNTSIALKFQSGIHRGFLADVIVGLRNPKTGVIQINGMDLRQLNLENYRQKLAFISRLEILEGSILDNLTYATPATLPEVQALLQNLDFARAIEKLPDGLDTQLAARGAPLSRTEQRLLMIARAILAKPSLIVIDAILDELDQDSLVAASKILQPDGQPWTLVVLTQSSAVAERFGKVVKVDNPDDRGGSDAV